MNVVFADTFYFLAMMSEKDTAHESAVTLSKSLRARAVTTEWVLVEVGDALSSVADRARFLELVESLRENPFVTIIPFASELFDRGLDLYAARMDKDWPLTDCISFVVMTERAIIDALTGDRHFQQAGFRALLA